MKNLQAINLSLYLQESKLTLRYATPLILTQVLQLALITIDTIMAGYYSELALAAVAQGFILWELCFLIILGLLNALAPLIAHAHGSDNLTRVRLLFQQGLYLAFICGIVGFFITQQIGILMHLTGVEAEIIPVANNYLQTIAYAIPFVAFFQIPRFLCEAIGQTKVLLTITCISIPINIVGNYLLLYGNFGFPEMGVTGIALSSVISIVVGTVCLFLYVTKAHFFKKIQLFINFTKPNLHSQLEILTLGTPISISLCMEVSLFVAVTLLMGKLGTHYTAANQIVFNYSALTFMIPLGLGMAITARVGRYLGQQQFEKARVVGITGMILGAGVMLLSALNITLFAEFIVGLYTDEKLLIELALSLIYYAALFQISDGIQVCALSALKGYRDTTKPMLFAIIGYWIIAIPSGYLLGFHFDFKGIGLLVGVILGLTFTAITCATRFIILSKNHDRNKN